MNILYVVPLSINYETLNLMLKFGGIMMAILLLIWLLAVATPKLAKFIDKLLGRVNIDKGQDSVPIKTENSDNPTEQEVYTVLDIYEGAKIGKNNDTNSDNISQ